MSAFEKGNDAHMIEVGMKDQKLCDSCLIDMECLELFQEIRDEVTHASADQHGFVLSLKKVDARLFRTEKP
jgi:hypothetical protein